jgi:hypothetical protein
LWQRTQQTQPQLMTIVFRNDKSLIVGDKLVAESSSGDQTSLRLKIEPLREILHYHSNGISLAYIASHKSFISNYNELLDLMKDENRLKDKDFENLKEKIIISDMIGLRQKMLSDTFNLIRPQALEAIAEDS